MTDDGSTYVVYAFQPRQYDPPRHIADDREELKELADADELVSYEQCDGCGNSTYRIERAGAGFVAVCAVDPDDDPEFAHPDPCGARYPISLYPQELVCF